MHADIYWGTPLLTVAAKANGSRVLDHLLLGRSSSILGRDGKDGAEAACCMFMLLRLLLHVIFFCTSSLV